MRIFVSIFILLLISVFLYIRCDRETCWEKEVKSSDNCVSGDDGDYCVYTFTDESFDFLPKGHEVGSLVEVCRRSVK